MSKDPAIARKKRRETELLLSESRWLQKATFALGKVKEVRAKLAESSGTEATPLTITVEEQPVPLPEVRRAFSSCVEELRSRVQARRYEFR